MEKMANEKNGNSIDRRSIGVDDEKKPKINKCIFGSIAGLPDFPWSKHTKTEIYQMTKHYIQVYQKARFFLVQTYQNGKIYQMTTHYIKRL
jgi:hypothetical protein